MATHFEWYKNSKVVVPWQARYTFPTVANKAQKITPRITPKSGYSFRPGNVIRLEFPAQGYVNMANTVFDVDVTLQGYSGNLAERSTDNAGAQVVRFQNGIQSTMSRTRVLYGANPIEDIIDYNVIYRALVEWTAVSGRLDNTSITEGIGTFVNGNYKVIYNPSGSSIGGVPANVDERLTNLKQGPVNVRQAYIQGVDTRLMSAIAGNTYTSPGPVPETFVTQYIPEGWGVVPNSNAGQSGLSGTASYPGDAVGSLQGPFNVVSTRRYTFQLNTGVFTLEKFLPVKFMASQLAVEITLAPETSCIYVERVPTGYNGATPVPPTYAWSNVIMRPEIIEFDPSYDAAVLEGLIDGGIPLMYSSWHTFSLAINSSTLNVLIQERSRSVKALFALQRRQPETLLTDSGTFFFDTSGTRSNGCLQNFQYRIGGRYFPPAPVQTSLQLGSTIPNQGSEAYVELQKALNCLGDYRLNPAMNTLRWGQGSFAGGYYSNSALEGDYTSFVAGFDAGGVPLDEVYQLIGPTCTNMGSQAFCMATSLETSNGVEISGLNGEEQSDFALLANWTAQQASGYIMQVFAHYDGLLVLRENNNMQNVQ